MGKKKIDMKYVKESSSRNVTFSKRRTGIFKKAHELATLCAAQILLVIFSPGGKPYSFGHPSVESVMQQYLGEDDHDSDNDDANPREEGQSSLDVKDKNKELTEMQQKLKKEREKGDAVQAANKAKPNWNTYFGVPIKNQGLEELRALEEKFKELRADLSEQTERLEVASAMLALAEKPVVASDPPESESESE